MSDIGKRLSKALDDLGISQTELARQLKVSTGTVSRWVNGERVPSGEHMIALQRALRLSQEVMVALDEAEALIVAEKNQVGGYERHSGTQLTPNQTAALRAWDWSGVEPAEYRRVVDALGAERFAVGGDAVPEYWASRIRQTLSSPKVLTHAQDPAKDVDVNEESPEVRTSRKRPRRV